MNRIALLVNSEDEGKLFRYIKLHYIPLHPFNENKSFQLRGFALFKLNEVDMHLCFVLKYAFYSL